MTAERGVDTIDGLVRKAVAARPEHLALADAPNRTDFFAGPPTRLTWSELDGHIDTMAAHLQHAGAAAGTTVALQLPNVVELVVSILACARLGAVAVPFPVQHRRHELESGMALARTGIMVTAARPDRPDQLSTVADLAEAFADRPWGPVQVIDDPTGLAPARPDPTPEPIPGDLSTICWTSGTTGTPKGVPRTHAQWLASARYQVEELQLHADAVMLCPFPIVNMAGIGGMLVPWCITGGSLVLHQPLDLAVFLEQIQSEEITYTVAPPALLTMLLTNDELLATTDFSSVAKISSGSAPLDPSMVEGWQQRGIEIVNVFGSNEGAAMLSTAASVPDPRQRARSFPVPARPGIDVRLVDLDSGTEIVEPARPGELRFRGPTIFDGYLDSDGSEFDDQGYYRTGDVFEYVGGDEPPRLLRFVDRAKDIIIRGGMNISAVEIEALTSRLDAIVECAAVAFPDEQLGERVGLFAVPAAGSEPSLDHVIDHLRGLGIASYKLPERLELIDTLPRNPLGKVLKAELRARWATDTGAHEGDTS